MLVADPGVASIKFWQGRASGGDDGGSLLESGALGSDLEGGVWTDF